MKYALGRKEATQLGDRAACPLCGEMLIAKPGSGIVAPHWAHFAGYANCDPWLVGDQDAAHQTPWHLEWKAHFVSLGGKDEVAMARAGVKHIADIEMPNGEVIEFQSKVMDPEKWAEREAFYGKMVVVYRAFNDDGSFRFTNRQLRMASVRCPIFWDRGPEHPLSFARVDEEGGVEMVATLPRRSSTWFSLEGFANIHNRAEAERLRKVQEEQERERERRLREERLLGAKRSWARELEERRQAEKVRWDQVRARLPLSRCVDPSHPCSQPPSGKYVCCELPVFHNAPCICGAVNWSWNDSMWAWYCNDCTRVAV